MPRFEPFAGVRYDTGTVSLDAVTAPPYDVIDEVERAELEARSPYNAVLLELSRDEVTRDRYEAARCRLAEWQAKKVLLTDDEASFYAYRMDYEDEAGDPRHTLGVIGALELAVPGAGDVLPHERTMPKPKGDRLHLLRACRANLSPIWGLSLAAGLTELCRVTDAPEGDCVDPDGVRHRLWRLTGGDRLAAIAAAVASEPVVIADGHHRYETALAYRDERRHEGAGEGDHDLVMAFVVELAEDELTVRPIHRLLSDLPSGFDVEAALQPFFELVPTGPVDATVGRRMADGGALALVLTDRVLLLRPRPETMRNAEESGLDSRRLDVALAALPDHTLRYQHGSGNVARLVAAGDADAGVLLRPATVAQIAATAHARTLMPEKTTFFQPKPRTGMVLRTIGRVAMA